MTDEIKLRLCSGNLAKALVNTQLEFIKPQLEIIAETVILEFLTRAMADLKNENTK